jgi:hypothetical protein
MSPPTRAWLDDDGKPAAHLKSNASAVTTTNAPAKFRTAQSPTATWGALGAGRDGRRHRVHGAALTRELARYATFTSR